MANLDRLPDTPEYKDVRSNLRAHLIAAMGQTATLLKRVQGRAGDSTKKHQV